MTNCYNDDYCPIDDNNDNAIYKGEDTDAFGQQFLTINITVPDGWVISKAELTIGKLTPIIFNSPEPPYVLHVSLNRSQTKQLERSNKARLAIFDTSGKKKILDGTVIIKTKPDIV